MSDPVVQIVIKHLSGAKANRIDQFPVDEVQDIVLGRGAGATIAFDSKNDDIVSRKHAVIRKKNSEPLAFVIQDLGSSNGTFLNRKKLTNESEILPDDIVELGSGGPKFSFDIQPRPANLVARTRIMSPIETTATRVIAVGDTEKAKPIEKLVSPPKVGVGKDTVQFMLAEERRRVSSKWIGVAAAVIAFALIGGGAIYWSGSLDIDKLRHEAAEQRHVMAQKTEELRKETAASLAKQSSALTQQIGLSAQEIVSKYGNSIVMIELRWRLYDRKTGRQIFHRTDKFNNHGFIPTYVKLENGKIVRWLMTDDERRGNLEISTEMQGSGFVVSGNGFILTNKHVAAGWMTRYGLPSGRRGLIYREGENFKKAKPTVVDDVSVVDRALYKWIPDDDDGYIFAINNDGKIQIIGEGKKLFYGRNDFLSVRFPGNALSIEGVLVRAASRGDVALIKIDSPQPLIAVDLHSDGNVKVGERIIVMGHPDISTRTTAKFITSEAGDPRLRREEIPEPTVTDGIVSKLGMELQQEGTTQISSDLGDAVQLSVVATGLGNSGGPVFNSAGKVIALFTYIANAPDGTRVSFAVPIKHGLDLLAPQRPQ